MTSPDENPYRSPGSFEPATANGRSPEDRLVARGRTLFLVIAGYLVLTSAGLLAAKSLFLAASNEFPTFHAVRFAVFVGLLCTAWQGRGWSILLIGLACAWRVFRSSLTLISVLTWEPIGSAFVTAVVLGVEATVLFTLILSKSLDAFFRYQARQRLGGDAAELDAAVCAQADATTTNDRITVATPVDLAAAQACQAALAAEGVEAFLSEPDALGQAGLPGLAPSATIKVQVAAADAARAFAVLRQIGAASGSDEDARRLDDLPDVAFPCEECGKPLSFPAERRGKVEICRHCGQYVDVPE
ncbi:MAG: hypothetical protein JW809_04465 [Pirellulales bacterium]|nr:hypothetical protein [Pirellulales bacterium]